MSIKMSASWRQGSFQVAIPLTQKSFKVSSSKVWYFGIKAFKLGSFLILWKLHFAEMYNLEFQIP